MTTGTDPAYRLFGYTAEDLKTLILWCRQQGIQTQALRLGDMEIQFTDPKAMPSYPLPSRMKRDTPRDDDDLLDVDIDVDDVDQKFAKALGVELPKDDEVRS